MDDDELRQRLAGIESRIVVAAPPAIAARRRHRLAVSFGFAPLLALALAATALGGAIAIGTRAAPGVENPGQPLAGAGLECMTPPQAADYIAAHGIRDVVWQVERDAPTSPGAVKRGNTTVQQATPPETGMVVPGSIIDGTLYMIVDQRQGASLPAHCGRQ